jgi:hypothetical protein
VLGVAVAATPNPDLPAAVQAAPAVAAAGAPVLAQGHIMLRRTEAALSPETEAEWQARVNRQLAESEQRSRAYADQLAQDVAARVKAYADAHTDVTAAELKDYARQVARQTVTRADPEVQGAIRQMADQAILSHDGPVEFAISKLVEKRLTSAADDPVAGAITRLADKVASARTSAAAQKLTASTQEELAKLRAENVQLQQQLTAQQQLVSANARAYAEAADAKLTATRQATDAQVAALATTTDAKLAGERATTRMALQTMAAANADTRRLLVATAADIRQELTAYADTQMARVAADTSSTLQKVAENARLDVLDLQAQTGARLAELQRNANRQAALLASAKAAAVEEKLAQTLQTRTTPAEVKALARQELAEATPDIRALALQTLADSQSYIRTVAKGAVTDPDDPAVKEAFQSAARDVITKDDKVVFAIRQEVAHQLRQSGLETGEGGPAGAPATVLGDDVKRPSFITGDDIKVDARDLVVKKPGATNAPQTPGSMMAALTGRQTSLLPARERRDWVDLRKYHVVVHEDGRTLPEMLGLVLKRAEPFTGPWRIKWKISPANNDILTEKFSLDTETTFEEFVGYLAQYLVNDRGVKLTFSLFDRERILVVSD